TVPHIIERKLHAEKITCLTAYDYPTARLLDEAGIDMVLVGDTLGQVVLGYDSTLPVTVEEVLHHLRAVRRAVRRALLIADLPFGADHAHQDEELRAAVRYVKAAGAECAKHEAGRKRAARIHRLAYADLGGTMRYDFEQFRTDVRGGRYPDDRWSYHWPTMLQEQFDTGQS